MTRASDDHEGLFEKAVASLRGCEPSPEDERRASERVWGRLAAEGGAPGAFTVTCTSGHSYGAAPVGGRYHFRRLGGR